MSISKYKKLQDLYTRGVTKVFDDGEGNKTVMWLQVMNPYEIDEARKSAQAARARIVGALEAGDTVELDAVVDSYRLRGRENSISDLLATHTMEWYQQAMEEIQVDEDWEERVDVMARSDANAEELEDVEREYLAQINGEWLNEVNKRLEARAARERIVYERFTDDELLNEYRASYLQRRGSDHAIAEYNYHEVYYAARECEAKPDKEGRFTFEAHARCDHRVRVFEDVKEVRGLPEELFTELYVAISAIGMSARDARFSARQESSSASSLLPSEEAASTPSILDAVS